MLHKLHLVIIIVLSAGILYCLWEYIATRFGMYLIEKELREKGELEGESLSRYMSARFVLNNKERRQKAIKKLNVYLYISIILSVLLWVIW